MIIAVDFDGTVVEHRYPDVGVDVPFAADWLRRYVKAGAKLILWTMRSGETLQDAVRWYEKRGIPLWGVNVNPDQDWTTSPKAYAKVYIDDAAFGCPLVPNQVGRPYVDWEVVGPGVMAMIEAKRGVA